MINKKGKTNREKYSTFSEYILNDEKVAKWLFVASRWTGAIIFSVFTYSLWIYGLNEAGIVIGIFTAFAWYSVIKFYMKGGAKVTPNITASQFVWNKEKIEVEKKGRGKTK